MATATLTGQDIAAAALRYKGQGYVYGGTGARPGDWDCSSFVSYILGRVLGLTLPGGSWATVTGNGTQHGPVVVTYATWTGAVTIAQADAAAGDLVMWPGIGTGGHIGIVLGPNQMVSALDPIIRGDAESGTAVTSIEGFGPQGVPMIFRRVTATAAGPVPALTGAGGTGWGGLMLAVLAGLGIGVGAIALVIGAAAVAALGAVWLASRAVRG